MNKDEQYQAYSELYKKLRVYLDLSRVSLDGKFNKAILLTFKQNFKVLITPQEETEDHPVAFLDGMILITDPKFKNLKDVLNNKEVPSEYKMLMAICKSFANKSSSKFYDMMPYPLKKDMEKTFKLKVNADNEYFLFGHDELRKRYEKKYIKSLKKDQKIKIKDSSAILLTHNGKRYIDIASSFYYMDGKYIYKEPNITKQVKVKNKKEANITSSKNGEYTYYKEVLKDGVDLSKIKNKVRYYKADGKEFILMKQKGEFFLKDSKGLIQISHPDLLVYFY